MAKMNDKRLGRRSTPKVQERIGRIFDGIQAGKTEIEIAQEEGVSDRQIRYDMRKPEFQIRMNAFFSEISRKLPLWIEALHESEDPLDRRTAVTLMTQLAKSKMPYISESLNVNLNVDATSEDVIFSDIFDKMSPEEQAPFIEAYKKRQVPIMIDSEPKIIDITPEEDDGIPPAS